MLQRALVLLLVAVGAGLSTVACTDGGHPSRTGAACDAPGIRRVVQQFGKSLKRVSVLAPRPMLEHTIRQVYAPFVTPRLLKKWLQNPADAPGKRVSSPWPARIDVDSVRPAGDRMCLVTGKIIYLTSVELAHGGTAAAKPVALRVRKNGRWRISAYSAGGLSR